MQRPTIQRLSVQHTSSPGVHARTHAHLSVGQAVSQSHWGQADDRRSVSRRSWFVLKRRVWQRNVSFAILFPPSSFRQSTDRATRIGSTTNPPPDHFDHIPCPHRSSSARPPAQTTRRTSTIRNTSRAPRTLLAQPLRWSARLATRAIDAHDHIATLVYPDQASITRAT